MLSATGLNPPSRLACLRSFLARDSVGGLVHWSTVRRCQRLADVPCDCARAVRLTAFARPVADAVVGMCHRGWCAPCGCWCTLRVMARTAVVGT